MSENDVGKVKRQCTKEYKTEVVDRIIRRTILSLPPRHRVKKGTEVHLYFGISADEAGRSAKIIKRLSPHMWIKPVFPLLMLGMTRADCERWLEGRVPPLQAGVELLLRTEPPYSLGRIDNGETRTEI